MDEAGWRSAKTHEALYWLSRHSTAISSRKLRLFGCACCRYIWHLLPDQSGKELVLLSEQFSDQRVGRMELIAARRSAQERGLQMGPRDWRDDKAASAALNTAFMGNKRLLLGNLGALLSDVCWAIAFTRVPDWRTDRAGKAGAAYIEAQEEFSPLLRDIAGNPFRPETIDPSQVTTAVTRLADAIYSDSAFDRMPILADALEDAGCASGEILEHCRGPGPHVRGCWVLDLILGKS